MDILSYRPNLLFLIWIRNKHVLFLLNQKLYKNLYYRKLIIALTTKETCKFNELDFIVWKVNGQTHREPSQDKKVEPACIYGISKNNPNGAEHQYYQHGKLHRDDGPAWIDGISIENPNGTNHEYYQHEKRHREDGPVIIDGISKDNPNGTKHQYYQHGKLHRDDGPACITGISNENPNGSRHSYYIDGVKVDPF